MNGKDGKPFKTREGGVLRLEDLLEIMNEAAAKRLEDSGIGADFDEAERTEIARKVGLAALKFADLQNQRLTNYIFAMAGEIKADDPAEQQLVLALDAFGRAVATSAEKYSPHILCDHIYKVAQAFSRFYTDCPILVDDTPEDVKASRLALADDLYRRASLLQRLNIRHTYPE